MSTKTNHLRKALTAVFLIQSALMSLILLDQAIMGGFSGPVGLLEILLYGFPWALSSMVYSPSSFSRYSLKKILVCWGILSLILAGFCIFEGTVLGYGALRAFWSYVYIIPACLSFYQAAKIRKW